MVGNECANKADNFSSAKLLAHTHRAEKRARERVEYKSGVEKGEWRFIISLKKNAKSYLWVSASERARAFEIEMEIHTTTLDESIIEICVCLFKCANAHSASPARFHLAPLPSNENLCSISAEDNFTISNS